MNKVWLVLQKELRELLPQRVLLLTLSIVPLMLVVFSGFLLAQPFRDLRSTPSATSSPLLSGLTPPQIAQLITALQFRILLLIQPLILPSVIAAYSVVGEKNNRTLEPLLAAPVRTWQLLLAKSLVAMLPAVAVTWISGGIFIIEVAVLTSPAIFSTVISPAWLILMVLTVPVIVLTPVAITIMVSSRVNDPRTATQVSSLLFIILVIGFEIYGGPLAISATTALIITALLALLGLVLLWGATRVFQREVILTRWT
jgi:ABC-2 type transport system permease protein